MSLTDYYQRCAIKKPAPMVKLKPWQRVKGLCARLRARKSRKDAAYALTIRPLCEARDGLCRFGYDVAPGNRFAKCSGESEWAHFGDWGRFKTRGLPPEERHTTAGSLMLCTFHHRQAHERRLLIVAKTDRGCNGPLRYREMP